MSWTSNRVKGRLTDNPTIVFKQAVTLKKNIWLECVNLTKVKGPVTYGIYSNRDTILISST
jgi:hypothetical protein